MIDIFKDYIGKKVRLILRNGKEYVGPISHLPGADYPYYISAEAGNIMSFKPDGCFLVDSHTGKYDVMRIEPVEKDIFKDFVGKKVRATQKSGEERVGKVHRCPGDCYPYVITYEEEDPMSYKSDGRYWRGGSSLDIVKLELVAEPEPDKNIFRDFLGKKVVATQRDGEKIAGVVSSNFWSDSYPYILTKHDGSQFTYTPEGWYWKGGINNDPDIVKLELAEEPEPEGKWGQVLLRSGGVGIEWKNPVEGKEEELLRVLRDCYGFYPNAEDYAVNRIKAIWE